MKPKMAIAGVVCLFVLGCQSAPVRQEAGIAAITKEGRLVCFRGLHGGRVIAVDLVNETRSESTKLVGYADELEALCGSDGRPSVSRVRVLGEPTPKFLLWGGNFKVNSFELTKT